MQCTQSPTFVIGTCVNIWCEIFVAANLPNKRCEKTYPKMYYAIILYIIICLKHIILLKCNQKDNFNKAYNSVIIFITMS